MLHSLSWLERHALANASVAAASGPLDPAALQPLIDQLEDRLREMDPDAEEVANRMRLHLGSGALQPLAAELVRQLGKFDFDSAGHTLSKLKAELKASS